VLERSTFKVLATNQIDVIYHNAAMVNFVSSYLGLKVANVPGTQDVLKLATQINFFLKKCLTYFKNQYNIARVLSGASLK